MFNNSFQNWKQTDIPKAQLILTDIPYQLGANAYGFELKREFVKAFYEKLYPLIQEDMFIQAEREEKKAQIQSLWGGQNVNKRNRKAKCRI